MVCFSCNVCFNAVPIPINKTKQLRESHPESGWLFLLLLICCSVLYAAQFMSLHGLRCYWPADAAEAAAGAEASTDAAGAGTAAAGAA